MVGGVFDQSFHVAAAHDLGNHVGLYTFLTQIENRDDVWMGAQPAHCLGFPLDAAAGGVVQAFGLNLGKGHIPVECGVVGQEDLLLATLSQEAFYLVAAIGKGRGLTRAGIGGCGRTGGSVFGASGV